ncbi:MAG TPA: LysM peptidoglycan-binding domain-containing protein [Candidatus Limnocylindrales bacterium]|nr:LysM peptidoglycan-binding domain-containing protein [Candidatus Limnocylindrales bacterium]
MKHRATIWVTLVAGSLFLGGCEETATRQAHVKPPAPTPAPTSAVLNEPLPLPAHPPVFVSLLPDTRPAIDVLIEQVDASYRAGQKEYKAGNLENARADFDRAVGLILSSGFQVDFDSRLSDLFDEIGESMHSYELDATQSTEQDESETASQPAPMDEIEDMTLPPGDPRLRLKAEQELISVPHDLPLTVNDSVLQYLSFFTSPRGRAIVERGLGRAGRYSEMIRRVLKQEGVPQDLIYLAQAESAFQPDAVSRVGARGIWQFMPFRGEEYDLDRSYWVDERSDPEKATRAAALHMRDLYDMFGDWYLVMAAYNSGPLNVVRAIERTGYADFWELQKRHALPRQTQDYVPIIIAMALVAKDPGLYGVQVAPEKAPEFETIRPGRPIDLRLVADATGSDIDDLRDLNPELLRNVTPNDAQFQLKVPVGAADKFQANIEQVPEEKWTSWRLHQVENGESLADVARRYSVSIAALESANHLEAHAQVPAGFWLNVPTAPPAVRLVRYRVQRGDTLEAIADRFDVTVAELKRWNHMKGGHVSRGMRLRIYAGGEPARASRTKSKAAENRTAEVTSVSTKHADGDPVEHRVKRGETLYSIAHDYGTTVAALRESNPFLAERSLEAGDVLRIHP